MARIEPEDVEEVAEFDLEPSDVQSFIEDAHLIVQRRCAPYATSADQKALASTETYVAAHLLTSRSPQVQSTSAEGMSISYNRDSEGDDYWNRAVLADPTGRLSRPDGWNVYSTHQQE